MLDRHPLDSSHTFNDEVLASDRSGLIEAADVDTARKRNTERLGAENGWGEKSTSARIPPEGPKRNDHPPYLLRATSDALTAKDSSMGSSGGTTEVRTSTTSSRSLPLGKSFLRPEILNVKVLNLHVTSANQGFHAPSIQT
jgi:hypothetical protein